MGTRRSIKKFCFTRRQTLASNVLLSGGLVGSCDWGQLLGPDARSSRHIVLTDRIVGPRYAKLVTASLRKAGLTAHVITIPVGERAKSIRVFERVIDTATTRGIDKYTTVIGLGGGVVNNVAGCVAATLYRGLNLVQVPTTVLAQLDAAIDFKQGINGPNGKNHIGAIYPASHILIDPELLRTLPVRQVRNGLSEAIKHGLTQSQPLLRLIANAASDPGNIATLEQIIAATVRLKVELLNMPAGNMYAEMLPQYGHAVGHALESVTHYRLLHGEAIAIGMCVMAEAALNLGLCGEEVVYAHYAAFSRFELPTSVPPEVNIAQLLDAVRQDKHYSGGARVALPRKIGSMNAFDGRYWTTLDDDMLRVAVRNNRRRHLRSAA